MKRLMAGVDFTPRSTAAAHTAVAIAERANADVILVHVVSWPWDEADDFIPKKTNVELLNLLVNEATSTLHHFARQFDYPQVQTMVVTGSPADTLTRLATEQQADMLVIGDIGGQTTGAPVGVGANAYRLVENGPSNVMVVKPSHSHQIRTVVAAISFVPVADLVITKAHQIARLTGARLHVVRVIPDFAELRHKLAYLPQDLERIFSGSEVFNRQRLDAFLSRHAVHEADPRCTVISGRPGPTLVTYLRDNDIDLVVLGTGTSYRPLGYPVGSTTHRILNESLSSVLVVRPV